MKRSKTIPTHAPEQWLLRLSEDRQDAGGVEDRERVMYTVTHGSSVLETQYGADSRVLSNTEGRGCRWCARAVEGARATR